MKLFGHILAVARQYPDHIAVADPHGTITYAELSKLIEQFSATIRELKIPSGSRIILSGNNSIDFLAMIIALVKEEMNVFLLDPRSSTEDLHTLLQDIPVNYVLLDKNLFGDAFSALQTISGMYSDFDMGALSSEKFSSGRSKLYFFSSGSTGKPKAFGFTDEQLTMKMQHMGSFLQLRPSDQSLVPLTITHSHGLMLSLPLLLSGGCVHYLSPKKSGPEAVLTYLGKNKISILTGVPYQYNLMLEDGEKVSTAMQSLRYVLCGSAPMSEHLAVSFENKFGKKLNQAYGVSEIGPICVNIQQEQSAGFTSVGKVLPYIEYKIVDEAGQPVAREVEGELVVRSEYMSDNYLNAPEETAQTFRDGWIYTQDIVCEDEHGNIFILGRKKNFINVSGYKIYPVEIEKVLLSMKGIKDVAVMGIPDDARGQKIQAVVSVFFPLKEEDIRDFCKQHLASYKVPHVLLIENELEHTSINKVSYAKYSASRPA